MYTCTTEKSQMLDYAKACNLNVVCVRTLYLHMIDKLGDNSIQ